MKNTYLKTNGGKTCFRYSNHDVISMMQYDMTVLFIMYGVVQILKLQANIAM